MSPLDLFLYILMAGAGLFVCWLLALMGMFLYLAGKGWLTGEEPRRKAKR